MRGAITELRAALDDANRNLNSKRQAVVNLERQLATASREVGVLVTLTEDLTAALAVLSPDGPNE